MVKSSAVLMMQLHGDDKSVQDALSILDSFIKSGNVYAILCTVLTEDRQRQMIMEIENRISKQNPVIRPIVKVDVWCNRGMDIGAFMWQIDQYESLLSSDSDHKIIFKYHTKSCKLWCSALVKDIAESCSTINRSLTLFDDNARLAVLGGTKTMLFKKDKYLEYTNVCLLRYYEHSIFGRVTEQHERFFIPGTMWWLRASTLLEIRRLFTAARWQEIYNTAPKGHYTDKGNGTPVHTMERILGGYAATLLGYQVKSFDQINTVAPRVSTPEV